MFGLNLLPDFVHWRLAFLLWLPSLQAGWKDHLDLVSRGKKQGLGKHHLSLDWQQVGSRIWLITQLHPFCLVLSFPPVAFPRLPGLEPTPPHADFRWKVKTPKTVQSTVRGARDCPPSWSDSDPKPQMMLVDTGKEAPSWTFLPLPQSSASSSYLSSWHIHLFTQTGHGVTYCVIPQVTSLNYPTLDFP